MLFVIRFSDHQDRKELRNENLGVSLLAGLRKDVEILHWSKAFADRVLV